MSAPSRFEKIQITDSEENNSADKIVVQDDNGVFGYVDKNGLIPEGVELVSNKTTDINNADVNSYPNTPTVNAALSNKVDKITGKSLISDSEIIRLAGVTNQDISTKLDKGSYTGNAGNLKQLIEDIYQPNVLISSVEPTRSVNTFTYPALSYDVLINKVRYKNPTAFVTTIGVASTGFKRTDLVFITIGGVMGIKIGAESTTVSVRPDLNPTEVAISFINVFETVISDPTPVDNQISIQDSTGVEKFRSDYIRFKGVAFNASQKLIEVNPLISNRVYLSTSGNDSTAEPQDRTKPFLTINAVVMWLLSQPHKGFDWYIETLSAGTFIYNINMCGVGGLADTLAGFNIINGSGATIELSNNYAVTEQEIFNFSNGTLSYKWTATSVEISGSMCQNITTVVRHDIKTVNMVNNNGNQYAIDRGWRRNLGANSSTNYINWGTLNYGLVCTNIADSYPASMIIKIGEVNNSCTSSKKSIFFNYTTAPPNVIIDIYNNLTAVRQDISATRASIGVVNSVNALVGMNVFFLDLKGNSSYTNVVFGKPTSLFGGKYIINGNGGTLAVNYTISSPFYSHSHSSYKNTANLYTNTESVLTNISIVLTGTVTCLHSVDFRNYGEQLVLDNCNISIVGKPLMLLVNFVNKNSGYQIIFKNSVRIINGTFMLDNGGYLNPDLSTSKLFLVQENASVFHDYGRLHTIGIFPPINQLNTYNNIRRNELRVSDPIQVISNSVRSDFTYVVDGILTLSAGQYINIPAGGATFIGYGFDVSKIVKNVAGQAIFTGTGVANLVIKDLSFDSGAGSVFDLVDIDGTHAIEFNDINFENCSSLGTLKGFRQFTGLTIGMYGCSDGLKLAGAWNGFVLSKLHVRGFASTGTLFKKDVNTSFTGRFLAGVNLSGGVGIKLLDFDSSNFVKDETLQLDDCTIEIAGVISPSNTTGLIPNISANNPKCRWTNSTGITLTAMPFQDIKSTNKIWRLTVNDSGVISAAEIV